MLPDDLAESYKAERCRFEFQAGREHRVIHLHTATTSLSDKIRYPPRGSTVALQPAVRRAHAKQAYQQHEGCAQQGGNPVHLLPSLEQAYPRSQRQRRHHHCYDRPGNRYCHTTCCALLRTRMAAQRHLLFLILTVLSTHIVLTGYHIPSLYQAISSIFRGRLCI